MIMNKSRYRIGIVLASTLLVGTTVYAKFIPAHEDDLQNSRPGSSKPISSYNEDEASSNELGFAALAKQLRRKAEDTLHRNEDLERDGIDTAKAVITDKATKGSMSKGTIDKLFNFFMKLCGTF
jgi:hypothetical protein